MERTSKFWPDIVSVVVIALLGVALYLSGEEIRNDTAPFTGYQRLEGLLGMAASTLGMILVGWWAAALSLALLSVSLRRGGHDRAALVTGILSPQFMKRLAAAVLGFQLVAGGSAAASALSIAGPPGVGGAVVLAGDRGTSATDVQAIEPQWKPLPGPVESGPLLRGELRQSPTPAPLTTPAVIEVRPGDSLWTIAARQLGPFATDVEIAQAWPLWHQENRQVIGDDPDLLLPGQLLRPPHQPR